MERVPFSIAGLSDGPVRFRRMAQGGTWAAFVERQERDAAKRRRELVAYAKAQTRWEERQRAEHEVKVYENQIEVLLSMHKDCGPIWDWREVGARRPPPLPQPTRAFEAEARSAADSYTPSFFDKLFSRDKNHRALLEQAIVEARQQDAQVFSSAQANHVKQLEHYNWEQRLSTGVLSGDLLAFRAVVDYLSPFAELADTGMMVTVEALRHDVAVLHCIVGDNSVVPREESKLTSTGKLSTRRLAASTYWGFYQDYVCGCALRVAREVFALLPLPRVVINVAIAGIDPSTGHNAHLVILATSIPREIAQRLKYDALDPSEALKNVPCRMKFKKSSGFDVVDAISADEAFITTTGRQ